mgnify:CR=1 FL=1
MLWVKAFHIVFVASWFAGLFYLPRIYVNLAMVQPGSVSEQQRLLLMARKLLRFTTLLSVPALGLGLWLWLGYGIGWGPGNGWMHAKLTVVLAVIAYHHMCARLLRQQRAGQAPQGRLAQATGQFFERTIARYGRALGWVLAHRGLTWLVFEKILGVVVPQPFWVGLF